MTSVATNNSLIARSRQIASRLPGLTAGTGDDDLDRALAEEHRGLCAELAGVHRRAEAVALRLLAEVQWTTGDEARARAQATAAALVAEFGLGLTGLPDLE